MKELSKYLLMLIEADKGEGTGEAPAEEPAEAPAGDGGGEEAPAKEPAEEPKKDKEPAEEPVFAPYPAGYFPLDKKMTSDDIQLKKNSIEYSLTASLSRDCGLGTPKKFGIGPLKFEGYDLMVHNREFDFDEFLVEEAAHDKYTYLELVDKCRDYWAENKADFKYWQNLLK